MITPEQHAEALEYVNASPISEVEARVDRAMGPRYVFEQVPAGWQIMDTWEDDPADSFMVLLQWEDQARRVCDELNRDNDKTVKTTNRGRWDS